MGRLLSANRPGAGLEKLPPGPSGRPGCNHSSIGSKSDTDAVRRPAQPEQNRPRRLSHPGGGEGAHGPPEQSRIAPFPSARRATASVLVAVPRGGALVVAATFSLRRPAGVPRELAKTLLARPGTG